MLWHVDLNTTPAVDATVLSDCEKDRARAINFPEAQSLYIVAHVRLREILGNWMNIPSSEVAFDTGWNGKPALKNASAPFFSLSHSGHRAVIAVSQTTPIGVDIETIRPRKMDRKTAQRFFSKSEAAALQCLSDTEHRIAFTRLWTFKEAFIKATGEGLARRLDSFEIDPSTQRLISGENPNEWQLAALDMPAKYAGALVAQTASSLRITVHQDEMTSKQHLGHRPKLMRLETGRTYTIGCTSPAYAI